MSKQNKVTAFELLGGTHVDENGKEHNKGDLVKSSVRLDKLFVNKFRRVTTVDVEVDNIDSKTKEPETDEVPFGTELPDDILANDENKIADYPLAVEKQVFVVRKGSWYYVIDPATPQEAMHERGLREDAVIAFLEEIE